MANYRLATTPPANKRTHTPRLARGHALAGTTPPPSGRRETLNCSLTQPDGERALLMKLLRWMLIAVVIALGLALLAGQSDLRRFQRMRRM